MDSRCQLAAALHLPIGEGPYPTLIYYVPYHKDDFVGANFEHPREYFARNGYASLLVDSRGTGSSTGQSWGTFRSRPEAEDGCRVVEWAAEQPWCNGNVGIWGVSYGGFTALHTAAKNPPHLKAVATVFGIQDPYWDFVAPGGVPSCLGNWMRETHMLTMDLAPPSWRDEGGLWRKNWLERIDALRSRGPESLSWMAHQSYSTFWSDRAIPVETIESPTLVMGGWRDLFSEAMVRTYLRLSAAKRLVMGPWPHVHPYFAASEPIDWLNELLRWWNRWLRPSQGVEQGEIADLIYVRGREAWADNWPVAATELEVILTRESDSEAYRVDPRTGIQSGLWDPLGAGIGAPLDQTPDDLRSWHATTPPFDITLLISGKPRVRVPLLRVDGGDLQLVVKLNDLSPSGESELITVGYLPFGGLDGARVLEVELASTCFEVQPGHRLRISLSGSDFPRVWPALTSATFTIDSSGRLRLLLPIHRSVLRIAESPLRPSPSASRVRRLRRSTPVWRIQEDHVRHSVRVTTGNVRDYELLDGGSYRISHRAIAEVSRDEPQKARLTAAGRIEVSASTGDAVQVDALGHFSRTSATMRASVTEGHRRLLDAEWTSESSRSHGSTTSGQ